MSEEKEEVLTPEAEVTEALTAAAPDEPNLFDEDSWLTENDPIEPDEVAQEAITPEAQAKEPKPSEEPEKAPEKSDEDREEYEGALNSLRLDGFDTADLEELSEAKILQLGKKASKRQSKYSKALQDRADELKVLKEQVETTKTTEPLSGEPTEVTDLKQHLTALRETYGEELAGPLEKAFEAIVKKAEPEAPQPEEGVGEQTAYGLVMAAELSRQQLKERFPELSKPEVWQEVRNKADALNLGAYATEGKTVFEVANDIVLDSIKIIGLEDIELKAKRQEAANTDRIRDNGQPETKSQLTPPKAMSLEEQDDWALQQLESGKSPEEVKRLLGST